MTVILTRAVRLNDTPYIRTATVVAVGLHMSGHFPLVFKSDGEVSSCLQISMTQGLWKSLSGALEGARLEDRSDDFLATVEFLDWGWDDALRDARRKHLHRVSGPTATENDINKDLMALVADELCQDQNNESMKVGPALEVCSLVHVLHSIWIITPFEAILTPLSVQDKDDPDEAAPAQKLHESSQGGVEPGTVGARIGGGGGVLGQRDHRSAPVDPVLSKAVTGEHSKGISRVEAEVPRGKPDTKDCTKGPATRSKKHKKNAK